MKTAINKVYAGGLKKAFTLFAGLLLITTAGLCQQNFNQPEKSIGVAVSAAVSPNGYGTLYTPMICFNKGRQSYFFGPVIQKQKMNLSGLQFNFDFTLSGADVCDTYHPRLELFCFLNTAFHHNALLGKQALGIERMVNKTSEDNLADLHFQSAEGYAGFGLKIALFENLKWVNAIGVGGYSSFNFPGGLYHPAQNLGLLIKTGISFDLKK